MMKFRVPEKLLGFVIAIIASFVVWLATEDVLSTILVALVTELIALTIETQIELSHTTEMISDMLSISEASSSYAPLREVVTEYDLVVRNGGPLHVKEAQRRLLDFRETIKDLNRGRISIPREDAFVRAGEILDTLEKGMLVTDIVTSPQKWSSGDHTLWQETNLRAAKKGLKITRIFIIKDKDFLSDEFPLANTMREQSEAGILVRYLVLEELEPDLIRDGALLDDKMVITNLFTPAGDFGIFTLETSSSVVEDNRRYFERILARSHPFEGHRDSTKS
jgi:hypothetical protein